MRVEIIQIGKVIVAELAIYCYAGYESLLLRQFLVLFVTAKDDRIDFIDDFLDLTNNFLVWKVLIHQLTELLEFFPDHEETEIDKDFGVFWKLLHKNGIGLKTRRIIVIVDIF